MRSESVELLRVASESDEVSWLSNGFGQALISRLSLEELRDEFRMLGHQG